MVSESSSISPVPTVLHMPGDLVRRGSCGGAQSAFPTRQSLPEGGGLDCKHAFQVLCVCCFNYRPSSAARWRHRWTVCATCPNLGADRAWNSETMLDARCRVLLLNLNEEPAAECLVCVMGIRSQSGSSGKLRRISSVHEIPWVNFVCHSRTYHVPFALKDIHGPDDVHCIELIDDSVQDEIW